MADDSLHKKQELKDVARAIQNQIAVDSNQMLQEEVTVFQPKLSNAERFKINIGLAQANEGLGISREEARKTYERFL